VLTSGDPAFCSLVVRARSGALFGTTIGGGGCIIGTNINVAEADQRGDATLYCRPEILTGKRFPKTVCLTAAELKAEQVHAREMLHSLDEGQPNFCNGRPCTAL
jgi:hypothetical protein